MLQNFFNMDSKHETSSSKPEGKLKLIHNKNTYFVLIYL